MQEKISHPIDPVYDENSEILILGSFPSVSSRRCGFFYSHPQNRFWKVLSSVFECSIPGGIDEKRRFLLDHGIALWDVIAACRISESSDSTIRQPEPNDLSAIFSAARIRAVFLNGSTAYRLFVRFHLASLPPYLSVVRLPSTSPANAACSTERLIRQWSAIKL